MLDLLMLLLLTLAVAIGYWLGRRSKLATKSGTVSGVQAHYIRGLNYLLNEQQDAAIDTFMEALEVNAETLETHLALGNLLRKRGEVSRAIKIHQNLLARPGLSYEQAQQVQLELARDYVKSGLLDRAETLLQELVPEVQPALRTECLEYLIEIYRDEKEWLKGVETINKLAGRRFTRLPDEWRIIQGHFYCEAAAEAIACDDYLVARRHLRSAVDVDKSSARSSLLLAELEQRLNHHEEAIKALKQVPQQQPQYISEAITLLGKSYSVLTKDQDFQNYLQVLQRDHADWSIRLAIAHFIERDEGVEAAALYIGEAIQESPSLRAVGQMLALQLSSMGSATGSASESIQMADQVIRHLQSRAPQYRCKRCGFSGQRMHWLCPGCKTWASIKNIQ